MLKGMALYFGKQAGLQSHPQSNEVIHINHLCASTTKVQYVGSIFNLLSTKTGSREGTATPPFVKSGINPPFSNSRAVFFTCRAELWQCTNLATHYENRTFNVMRAVIVPSGFAERAPNDNCS